VTADDYGAIVTGATVRAHVEATVKAFMPAYLAEVARQDGRTSTPPNIRAWVPSVDPETFPADQLPAGLVIVPGIVAGPSRRANTYSVGWQVGVGAVVRSTTRGEVMDLLSVYTAAIRAILAQHPSCGGIGDGWEWVDENSITLDVDGQRTIAAGQVTGILFVPDVVAVDRGPAAPPADPALVPAPWGAVSSTEATVTPSPTPNPLP
jgi:hypothetical protein